MNVIERLLSGIVPASWNVRTGHDVEGIAESIRVNGFRDPIEIWAFQNSKRLNEPHEIVAGEGRYHAARKFRLTTVPVIEHEFDGLASAKRYSIANNRETDKSLFDAESLLAQLEELPTLDGTGFDLESLAELREGMRTPGTAEWDGAINLPEGEKTPFEQMTFTLSVTQAEQVKVALQKAKDAGQFVDTGNENSNGNALARIAEAYHGSG